MGDLNRDLQEQIDRFESSSLIADVHTSSASSPSSSSSASSSSSSSQATTTTSKSLSSTSLVVQTSEADIVDEYNLASQANPKLPGQYQILRPASTASQQIMDANQASQQQQQPPPPLNKIVCVDEFEQIAKTKLDKAVYDYYSGGSDDQVTLRWNRQMISERYCLRPRVMCDVSRVDLTKYIYGDRLSMPIGISPTSMHKMAHPDGELATVRAANRINALMVLSLFSTTSLEDVAKQAQFCTKWQNLYILKNREITQNVINRAIRNAYRAIVVTCDAPILGNRRHDVKNDFTLGQHTLENIHDSRVKGLRDHSSEIFDPSVTWQDLADLKKGVGDTIKVVAKGIMTPEDAEQALQAGVDGIFVSNHGGRQLDGAQSTIEVLPAIVRAVNKRCPVFVDSGFRTGADILKALALGADMVFVGRSPLMGLASYGEDGVYRALELLQEELKRAMMLCGCNKLSDINRNIILERQ